MDQEQQIALLPFDSAFTSADEQNYHRLVFERWHRDRGFNARSVPNRGLDFYSDCLGRHANESHDALRYYEDRKQLGLSFTDLYSEVRRCAESWSGNGVQKRDSVAIMAATPVRRTIALLAGLRLGVRISLLPVTGSSLLKEHLEGLSCDHLHIETAFLSWVPDAFKSRVLKPDVSETLDNEESVTYKPMDIVLRLLDPYSGQGESVLEIPAGFLFQRLLQDAFIIQNLERGQIIAGGSAVMTGVAPFPELASLLCGACYWFLEPSDWRQHAASLVREPLDVISIPAQARAALVSQGEKVEQGRWKRWIRNPTESLDYQSWRDFADTLGLDATPHADLLYSCHMAGISLGNDWSLDLLSMGVQPPAASRWQLGDLLDPKVPTAINHGRFCPLIANEAGETVVATPFMLTPFDGSYRFVGHYPPGRQGRAYPSARVVEALKREGAHHAIIEKPGAQGVQSMTLFVLLVFQDSRTEDEIRLLIQQRMGEAALPDEIITSSLFPRLSPSGQVDKEWITRMFFRGEIARREVLPFYQSMARVKAIVHQKLSAPHS